MNDSVHVKEMTEKGEWEAFLLAQDRASFLQSWNSKIMSEKLGHRGLALGVYAGNALAGICLIEEVRAKRGNYLSAAYGPVFKEWRTEYLQALTDFLTAYGKKNNFHFLRFSPFVEDNAEMREHFAACGFKTAPIHLLAETLWLLDVRQSEEDLLKGMRKTTRNLVRRAIKEQVVVDAAQDAQSVETFIQLHKETEARHQFVAYNPALFREQVAAFAPDNQVMVLKASHQNALIASAIVMYYGTSGAYHHGASIPSKIPAAYLLQWSAIKEAKNRGCAYYNFWGITESDDKKHPFYGLSLFKKGFGGQVMHLLPCQDLALSPRYRLTFAVETIRRIRRGFGWKRA